ncbi:hypothetical protein AC579_9653 [Pseudocercospora musae]|uniref:RING-type domain-containing protein n=1 Tax=Pseudocercospora musae TaxID=113226 RepID=A0A139IJB3_9PEZI|nr:hypothetical protein AC579_9653 [Pseudocercospora musae]
MADNDGGGSSGGGLLDLEKELQCSICTDVLYQPLTLLDCLHTFCGGCLKEWFTWQATAATTSRNNRHNTSPYTCPQCREHVRGTKADWRTTTLLEGFLKANPGKGKSDEEKEESRQQYTPGDDVLPAVQQRGEDTDSEDERLLAEVRDISMANVDPETARRRAERAARRRQERSQRHVRPEELGRQQQSSRWVAHPAARQREEDERQVEHQPSLRSLLSDSEISSADVQEEILQSISSEGLLDGIDIDHLTPAQEEELTERIAEAYRRRQRNRDRSRNRDRGENQHETLQPEPRRTVESSGRRPPSPPQQTQTRSRPPISRPHLFEQSSVGAERGQRRSASSTSQRTRQSEVRETTSSQPPPAARSATDLAEPSQINGRSTSQPRPRALSGNSRSSTDPAAVRDDLHHVRAASNSLRPDSHSSTAASRPRSRDSQSSQPGRRRTGPATSDSVASRPEPHPSTTVFAGLQASPTTNQQSVRPAASASAFAPVPVSTLSAFPTIACSCCQRPDLAQSLHYNCSKCNSGNFNLCLSCYRDGRGCRHWFGFGLMAMYRYHRAQEEGSGQYSSGYEYPHLLNPRQYMQASLQDSSPELQEGAFCEHCLKYTNDCYWYCEICLEGAWGYCNTCVLRGNHCTHPLLPLAHISTLRNASHDPSKLAFLPVPHLKQHSYVLLPVLTDCDICRLPIPPRATRFHCYTCSDGDYDICNDCYNSLVAMGKISSKDGPNGWRRCLEGHRMSVIGYQDTPYGGGQRRLTLREMVGGRRLKEEGTPSGGDAVLVAGRTAVVPPDGGVGYKCLAQWSRWPKEGDVDELAFPKNAEIRECEDRNSDWAVGVYDGTVGLFPVNHTRKI